MSTNTHGACGDALLLPVFPEHGIAGASGALLVPVVRCWCRWCQSMALLVAEVPERGAAGAGGALLVAEVHCWCQSTALLVQALAPFCSLLNAAATPPRKSGANPLACQACLGCLGWESPRSQAACALTKWRGLGV